MLLFFRYLNFLSLDATVVALVWQEVFALTGNMQLHWHERAALGITVWIIYIADHLLDSLTISKNAPPLTTRALETSINIHNTSARHHFIAQHKSFFTVAIISFIFADLLISLHLNRALLISGGILSIISFFYLLINAWLMSHQQWFRGRELIVALIFSLGCGLVPLLQSKNSIPLFLGVGFFACICAFNTTLIARMERDINIQVLLAPIPKKLSLWIKGTLLFFIYMSYYFHIPPIDKAAFISLFGLSLTPWIAKKQGYETASLAVDGMLIFGGVMALL